MTTCDNDIDLLHKFIKSTDTPAKTSLPDDMLVHLYVAGISCLMLIVLVNIHRSL
jgi:hypothetical protein